MPFDCGRGADRRSADLHALEERTKSGMHPSVAVIEVLATYIQDLNYSTSKQILEDIQGVISNIKSTLTETPSVYNLTIASGCDLFKRYVFYNSSIDSERFKKRALALKENTALSKSKVAQTGTHFIVNNSVILLHGYSRVVVQLLREASRQKRFRVITTEGRPEGAGVVVRAALEESGIPVEIILDSAVAYHMDSVNLVMFGALCVAQSGGVINRIGTYQIAMIAHVLRKPVYIATENFKFVSLFPLSQRNVPTGVLGTNTFVPSGSEASDDAVPYSACDYTPPHLITLLLTEGIEVPDELNAIFHLG